MIYPGYQLNPGDMFQVDPDRVMFATGTTKNQEGYFKRRRSWQRKSKSRRAARAAAKEGESEEEDGSKDGEEASTETADAVENDGADAKKKKDPDAYIPRESEASVLKDRRKTIKGLLDSAKSILEDPRDRLSAHRKRDWRVFSRLARATLSRAGYDSAATTTTDLETRFAALKSELTPSMRAKAPTAQEEEHHREYEARMEAEEQTLREALARAYENPVDNAKPYATPWKPRPYMSAFAFIPRYLEVNQNVCAAVYLRHPVARPGLAEVPTPFNLEASQLAFNWYLRRG